ncbi:MAG: DNA-binding protein [Eubacterium sp.]|nr:DNA-binding protein [Eubacterium sp.]
MQEYMGTKEASEKWDMPQWKVQKLCREKKIPGAEQDAYGSPWRIPIDAVSPKS